MMPWQRLGKSGSGIEGGGEGRRDMGHGYGGPANNLKSFLFFILFIKSVVQ